MNGWVAVKPNNPFIAMGGTETGISMSQIANHFKNKN